MSRIFWNKENVLICGRKNNEIIFMRSSGMSCLCEAQYYNIINDTLFYINDTSTSIAFYNLITKKHLNIIANVVSEYDQYCQYFYGDAVICDNKIFLIDCDNNLVIIKCIFNNDTANISMDKFKLDEPLSKKKLLNNGSILIDSSGGVRIIDYEHNRNYIIDVDSFDEIIDGICANDHFILINTFDEFVLFDNINNIFRTTTYDFKNYFSVSLDNITIVVECEGDDDSSKNIYGESSHAYILKHCGSSLVIDDNETLFIMRNLVVKRISLESNNNFLLVEYEYNVQGEDVHCMLYKIKTVDIQNEIVRNLVEKLNVDAISLIDSYIPYLEFYSRYSCCEENYFVIDADHNRHNIVTDKYWRL